MPRPSSQSQNPVLRRLASEWLAPTRQRLWVSAGAIVAYAMLLPILNAVMGSAVTAFALVPPLVVGSLLGWRMALGAGIVTGLVTLALLSLLNGPSSVQSGAGGLVNSLLILAPGVAVGWISERISKTDHLARGLAKDNQTFRVEALEHARAEQALRKQNESLAALQETALGLVGRLDVDELLQEIVTRAGALVDTQNGYVFLLDAEAGEMVMRVGVGAYEGLVGTRAQPGVGLAGQVWKTGETLVVDDYRTWSGRIKDTRRDLLRAVIGVPLKRSARGAGSDTRVVGVIGLAYLDGSHKFGANAIDMLDQFAALASLALDNAQLYESAQRELSQRRATEEKLQAEIVERENAQRFLDSIVDNLPTMLFVKEARDLRFVRWNKAGERIAGRTRKEFIGRNDYDFFPKDEADFFVAKDRETLSTGKTLDILEEPIESANGEIRWLHTQKFPIYDAQGNPQYLVGISEDITERKLAQERATFQNALLSAQYDASPDGILVVGSDDRILSHNKRFLEMWNIPADALASGTAEALRLAVRVQLADVEGWLRRTAEIYMRHEESSSDEIVFKDGRTFERYSTPVKTPEGTYLGRVWFFHDITEIRRTEEDLQRVMQGARALFWRAQVTRLADQTEGAFGFRWETRYANPDTILQFIPLAIPPGGSFQDAWYQSWLEEDSIQMDRRSADALRSGREGYSQEYRLCDAEGKIHWMYEDARIRRMDDTHFEVVGFSNEITERKLAEQALQEQNAYLNALQDTAIGLMGRLDVNALLQDIVARAGALVGTENGYVFIKEADSAEMEMRVGVGAYEGFVGRRTQPGVGLAGQVWESGAPIVVDDYRLWGGRLADASRDILRAVVGVPMRYGSEVVGVIGLAYLDETRKFGDAQVRILERFAQLASIALDNARLYETLQQELVERTRAEQEALRRNRELYAINHVSSVMTTNIDMRTALETLARELVEVFHARNCGIALLNKEGTELTVVADALTQAHEEHSVGIVIPVKGNPSSQYVIENRKSLVIPDAQTDSMTAPIHERMRQRRTKCLAIIPLLSAGQVIGTIGLDTTDPEHVFSEDEIRLAETMANQMANAIAKQYLFDEARQRAQETEIINEMARELSGVLEENLVFETTYKYVRRLMPTDAFIAWYYAEESQQVTRPVLYGLDRFYPDTEEPRPPSGNVARVVETGEAVLISLTHAEWEQEKSGHDRIIGADEPSASLLYVPLRVGDHLRGVLSVQSYQFDVYGAPQLAAFTAVASHVAAALENARLFAETNRRLSDLSILHGSMQTLTQEMDMQVLLARVAQQFRDALDMDTVSVLRWDTATNELVTLYDLDPDDATRVESGTRYSFAEFPGLEDFVMLAKPRWFQVSDTNMIPELRADFDAYGWKTQLLVPLVSKNQVVGMIELGDRRLERNITPDELRLAESLANQAAVALENAHLFEQTQDALQRTQQALRQVEQARQHLDLQYQTANLLAKATSFDQVATRLLELACRAFGWQMGEYWAVDETAKRIHLTHKWHGEDERIRSFVESTRNLMFAPGEGLAGRTWAQGKPVWVPNIYDSLGFNEIGVAKRAGLQSAVSFPLMSETRTFGVATFFSVQPQPEDDAVFVTMTGVASQIGQFMERRRAEEAVRQQNMYLTALHDTTLGLMRRLDLDELLQNIITRAAELVGTEHGYVHLVEPGGNELRMRVGIGIYHDFVGTRVKPGQGLAGTVWRDETPIIVDDYRYWQGRLPMVDRDVLRAVVGVPLKSGDQTVGVLGLASLEEGRRFGTAQIEALNRFAELAAVALDNAQLYMVTQNALEQSQRAAKREKASAEITDKLYAAPDVPTVLRTAAEELRRSTGSRRAVVRLRLGANPVAAGNGKADGNGAHGNSHDEARQ